MSSAWMQTYTGKRFDILDPNPGAICIEDVAHALSMLCRYNGHCRKFYSVAEHSVWVSRLLPFDLALPGLLHDAAEAYVSDIPTPLKRHVEVMTPASYAGRPAIRAVSVGVLEKAVLDLVWKVFGIAHRPEAVELNMKRADLAMLMAEAGQLMGPPPEPWGIKAEPADVKVECWPPELAERRFLARFHELTNGQWLREAA